MCCDALIHFSSHHFTLIKLTIKSHSFFISFFFLLTFDGGGEFYELIDSWKIEEGRIFQSHTSHSFFFSFTLTLSLSLSVSHKLINLFYFTLTLFTLVINSIELIWTSPFQKYSLSHSFSPGHVSHLHSLTCD